jgi:hypothetical protein
VRARPRGGLRRVGYHLQPEGTIYAETLSRMSDEGTALVEMKDGTRFSGCPRNGPQCEGDGVRELYLVYAKSQDEVGGWEPIGGQGVILPLSEVRYVVLSEDPTGAPPMP